LKTVGQTLRLIRESKRLLLREVAASIKIDPTLLSKIERGQRKATKEQVIKLARFFKADKKELLVLFLSDRIVSEVQNETLAKEAIQLAEQQIKFITSKKKTKKK
jgi:transcriptional regulator with XRE-family HTH domain